MIFDASSQIHGPNSKIYQKSSALGRAHYPLLTKYTWQFEFEGILWRAVEEEADLTDEHMTCVSWLKKLSVENEDWEVAAIRLS